MFTAMSIASRDHVDRGTGWCSCGETIAACWFQVIFFPYQQICMDRLYGQLFEEVS